MSRVTCPELVGQTLVLRITDFKKTLKNEHFEHFSEEYENKTLTL